jgi:beta-phosphoglucomutase-like phosphatase (HAD superfamily)
MKITRILFAATIMLALVSTSCQQKSGQKESATTTGEDEFTEKLMSVNPVLRDPSIIMVALDMAGAEYMEGLVIPMENADYYAKNEAHAALALGMMTVDVAYLASYGKTEQAIVKYERARKLANVIGLQSSFEETMFKKYITAGANPDSLRKHLTLTAENVDRELTKAEKARHITLYVTGGFIEKMYLVTQIIKKYPEDLPADARNQLLRHLMIAVADQEEPLDNLINLLDQIREEDEGEKFMGEMNKLKEVYTEANFKEMISNWTPETTGGGGYLAQITDQVESMRTWLVELPE